MSEIFGQVHSFQTLGAVDGPGLRFVVFMQGCPFRCIYCHNPDTWEFNDGQKYSADEIVQKVLRYKSYFKNNGGVTVSGGEPLCQSEFVAELFKKLKEQNIHTALDTTGMYDLTKAETVLKYTDLVLCDLKFTTDEEYKKYVKGDLTKVLDFMKLCEKNAVPMWIRHVVVPNLTDSEKNIKQVLNILKNYSNIEKIELLPFHKLCNEKYEKMGIEFPLKDTPECLKETIEKLYKLF